MKIAAVVVAGLASLLPAATRVPRVLTTVQDSVVVSEMYSTELSTNPADRPALRALFENLQQLKVAEEQVWLRTGRFTADRRELASYRAPRGARVWVTASGNWASLRGEVHGVVLYQLNMWTHQENQGVSSTELSLP